MRIVVIGIGKLGKTLTKKLSEENYDVTCIDHKEDTINQIVNDYDVIGYAGNGASYDCLKAVGAEGADLLIAVTSQDEVNILACIMGKKLGIKETIARVRNIEYSKNIPLLSEDLGISSTINPELDTAKEILRIIQFPSAIKVESFCNDIVTLIEIKLDKESPLCSKTLTQIKEKYPSEVLVCAVKRMDSFTIPKGDFTLMEGDNVYIIGTNSELIKMFKKAGIYKERLKSTMLIGASKICYYVANELIHSNINVKIIEKDKNIAESFAELLPKATVIVGDATNNKLLHEEGIESVDSIVTLTGMDETNIIISTYANTIKCPKIITKVNNENYKTILGSIKLDTIVSPKLVSSDNIIRYVRGIEASSLHECKNLYKLADDKVEALEFVVPKNMDYFNIPLKDIDFKDDILLASIIRMNKVIIPSGKDVIMEGDTLIIVSPEKTVKKFNDIFK